MFQHLGRNVRITKVFNSSGAAAASTALYGRPVDMQGFEGCCFIAIGSSNQMGASTDVAYMRIQGANTTAATFYSLSGTTASSTMGHGSSANWSTANFDQKILISDVYKPLSTHRHLRPILVGTSTGNFASVIAIQYGLRNVSTSIWKGSTNKGSTRWQSTKLGGQTVVATPAVTTATTK
jgi:hypothetical protein